MVGASDVGAECGYRNTPNLTFDAAIVKSMNR